MDECLALEEHFGNLDWALNDKDPELGSIDSSLLTTRRADPTAATTPTPLPATIINLLNAPDAPPPSGLQGALNAVTNPNAFRDMAGLAATQASAQAALNTAASLATNFGNQAAAIKLADMASRAQSTGNAPQQLAAVQKAKDQGLVTDAVAADHASKILGQMHTPGGDSAKPLTQEPDIQTAIQRASTTAGGEVNASRNTVDGREDVQLKFAGDSDRPFIIEPADKAAWAGQRAFGPSATQPNITGVTVLKVTTRPIPQGGSVRWSVPPNQQGRFTLAGGQKVQSGLRADVSGIRPGISAIDFDVLDANGVSVESQKYPLCIPQFVAVNDSTPFDAVLAGFGLPSSIDKDAVLSEAKTTCNALLSDGNVRTVWTMAPFNEVVPGHLGANMVTRVDISGNPPPGRLSLLGTTKDRNLQTILVGPGEFDEFIQMFPGAMVDPFATDIDQIAIQTVQAAIAAPPLTSNPANSFAVKVVGRVLGATMAHEILHTLVGVVFPPPDRAHTNAARDLLRNGGAFTFEHLTGIQITNAAALPAGGFTDLGPGHINRPQINGSLPPLQAAFPVPPVFQ
jgi:hypothetical protein